MMTKQQFANSFAKVAGHRVSQMIAATLAVGMIASPASAMLPTPEPELDDPSSAATAAIAEQNTMMKTGASALTDQAPPRSSAQAVTSKITAALVTVDANGQESLVPVDASTQLKSGDVLEYRGYFTNTNPDRVQEMTVTLSVPDQVTLLSVVTPEFPLASVDGETFARMPLQGIINGQQQAVPLKYYRAVRWEVEGLGLNGTMVVKYRAKVK